MLLSGGKDLSAEDFLIDSETAQDCLDKGDSELTLYGGLSVADAEKKLIFETLRVTGNNKSRAADMLGISIRTLRNKLHEYGASVED